MDDALSALAVAAKAENNTELIHFLLKLDILDVFFSN